MKRVLLWLSALLFAAMFVLSGAKIWGWYEEGRQSQSEFDAVAALLETKVPAGGISGAADDGAEPPILEEYRALYEANSDFVGWVSIEDTKIDYPVMQTPEEPDFYLRRNFEKQSRDSGVPYMQSDCDLLRSDNLIIYGLMQSFLLCHVSIKIAPIL